MRRIDGDCDSGFRYTLVRKRTDACDTGERHRTPYRTVASAVLGSDQVPDQVHVLGPILGPKSFDSVQFNSVQFSSVQFSSATLGPLGFR